ncbi:MAG: glutathione S-transferase family protein [Bdellovibrionales bacterium]
MLKLYGFKKVNAVARGHTRDLRILWALEEMQIPFELVGMDHPAHDLNTEAFHKLNPFEQIPVIDDDGIVLSESAAILIYLAKKSGRLIPSGTNGEAQVVRWCFAAMNSIEIPLMNILMIDWFKDHPDRKYREFLVGWANRHLSNLDRWFGDRQYVATDSFTVADILMAHVLAVIKDESLLRPYNNTRIYRDRCLARPAWQHTIERYYKNVEAG